MTIVQMLTQSGLLTVLGMGVVFCFIVIMIIAMHILHAVIHALKLDVEAEKTNAVSASAHSSDDAAIAAIAVAAKTL